MNATHNGNRDGEPRAPAGSRFRWKQQRERAAFLALEDGTVLSGYSVGSARDALGEVVFNTGMTGYQEIITDPSYSGQFVTMTYPEIGNTGVNAADVESRRVFANGLVIHELNLPSNWRAEQSLAECLADAGVPAIAGIDTRRLTAHLRDRGTLKGFLSVTGETNVDAAVKAAREWCGLDGQDYASRVTCSAPYAWDPEGRLTCSWGIAAEMPRADMKVVAVDFGIKWNILRHMRLCGMDVTVVPARTPAEEILARKPNGVLLSNGPADPAAVTYAIQAAQHLIGKVPVMGICLGHQILGWAVGSRTYRLKFGHHGCNHPVKDLETGRIEITSQNHNFAVDPRALDASRVQITHVNLNDQTVEGLRHRAEPMFAVQYHPEAGPGPHDPSPLFRRFRDLMVRA
jgi:carbamoyl-phosphate synthase small subunit